MSVRRGLTDLVLTGPLAEEVLAPAIGTSDTQSYFGTRHCHKHFHRRPASTAVSCSGDLLLPEGEGHWRLRARDVRAVLLLRSGRKGVHRDRLLDASLTGFSHPAHAPAWRLPAARRPHPRCAPRTPSWSR
jgi:hypothetical protein